MDLKEQLMNAGGSEDGAGMPPEEHQAEADKVAEGLTAILNSQDINECHQIAEATLAEHTKEESAEGIESGAEPAKEDIQASLSKKLMATGGQ